jgi:HK97 family phage major capsid protein
VTPDEFTKRLIDERLRAVDAAKAIQFDVETRGGDWSAEDEERWNRANEDIDKLDKRIKAQEQLEKRNRESEEQRAEFEKMVRPSEFAAKADSDEERLRQFCRASLPDSDTWAPRAITFKFTNEMKQRVMAQREQRVLSKLTAGAGGNVVPTGFVERLYAHLVEAATVRQFAGNLTTSSGENLLVPKTTTHGAAALVAEAGTIAASDAAFGQVTMNAYKYGQLIQLSTELVQDTAVDLLGYIAESGGRNVGLASGTHFVTGTGTSQPEGIMTNITAGVTLPTGNTLGFTTAGSIDALFDLYHSIVTGYRARGVWVMNDATLAKIRKTKDTTNQYLWQPGLAAGTPDTILGRPVFTDPNVAVFAASAKVAAFGDFTQYYLIRDVDSVRFERSDDFAFSTDLITFRVLIRTDGKPIDTTAAKSLVASAT